MSGPVVSRGEGSFDKLRTNGNMGDGRTEMGGGRTGGEGTGNGRGSLGLCPALSAAVLLRQAQDERKYGEGERGGGGP